MKKFKSHKTVLAQPMTLGVYNTTYGGTAELDEFDAAQEGYMVQYEPVGDETEGYISWSPKLAFELGYTELKDNKVAADYIESLVSSLTFQYARIGNTTTTVCEAFLPNGFSVGSGKSACVDPDNFDFDDGCKYARENALIAAKQTLWQLEGYVLKTTGTVSNPSTPDFGQAIKWLKEGRKVARKGWNGKGMWLKLIPAGNASFQGFDMQDCIGMKTATGVMQPGWLASQNDMLAEDWVLVE